MESCESSTDNQPAQTPPKTPAALEAVEGQAAKQVLGDKTVCKTYFKSVGVLRSTVFLVGAMAWSVCYKFSGKYMSIIFRAFIY